MSVSRYNVTWGSPSEDAAGSMPLGNGTIGLNVWIEKNGDLLFYIGRGDAWGEFGQLYKVGKVRIRIIDEKGIPFLLGELFKWSLELDKAAISVITEKGKLRLWVDANHPVIHVSILEAQRPVQAIVKLEVWRNNRRYLDGVERLFLHNKAPYDVYHEKDESFISEGGNLIWYHHNEYSSWRSNLGVQGLEKFAEENEDPLLHRCFGGLIRNSGFVCSGQNELKSTTYSKELNLEIVTHCQIVDGCDDWIRAIETIAEKVPSSGDETAWLRHLDWWKEFWDRSWIHAYGCEAARRVSQNYTLQRFVTACAGRGDFPIKFNGSIFTVDWNYSNDPHIGDERLDADYRRWGPGYWHQNTRLPYWAMLQSGDFDLIKPYFKMYRDALSLARERCQLHCGHQGAFFSETMWFWGAFLEYNYGYADERELGEHLSREADLPAYLCQNKYIRHHHSSGLEVVFHGLILYRYTGDEEFLCSTVLPLAEAVLAYYDEHFQRKDQKLIIKPAQVLEQWWEAENPLPEIAGLKACLEELLSLPNTISSDFGRWERMLRELPDIPTGKRDGSVCFNPAESWGGPEKNFENPELYMVFPYNLCNLESSDLEVGRCTFKTRKYTHDTGWAQDGIQSALLGLTEDTKSSVLKRLGTPSPHARFPVFWGPSFDWLPDQDQGGSASCAFQFSLMQSIGDRIHLLPAWPEHWSVDFKLVAKGGVAIHGVYKEGIGLDYKITEGEIELSRVKAHLPEVKEFHDSGQ